jgi:hypothetical protein
VFLPHSIRVGDQPSAARRSAATIVLMRGRPQRVRHRVRDRIAIAVGVVAVGLLLAACAAPPSPADKAPPLAPGMARVWFLRLQDPPNRAGYAAVPMVYVDRAPLVPIEQGTAFFHDFPAPGRYRLSVQNFGLYSGQHDILHLEPGTETYVQVLGVANWELETVVGGWSFAVAPMTAAAGKAYLLTLSDLGRR